MNDNAWLDVMPEVPLARAAGLRVDLGDPQGFAYALRKARQAYRTLCAGRWPTADEAPLVIGEDLVRRHLDDQSTLMDRLELAQALAFAVERGGVS